MSRKNKSSKRNKTKERIVYYPIQPENPDDEDSDEDFPVSIQVGDLQVASKRSNLEACKRTTIELLQDKTISNYLKVFKIKKIIPTGVG